ncbi:MAG TPA: hypothetical protein VLZ06_01925 [Solirubrobacteraceae bacterium]|nr:hypothetical protein [Solirubrobacteraceae bacterium]
MTANASQTPRPRTRARRRAGGLVAPILAVAALAAWLPSALAASTGPPQVATGGVSHVRGSTAELEGTVDPHGLPTTYFFQFGPTTGYGSSTPPAVLPAATTRIKVGQITGGLQPGYHYRIVAYNGDSGGFARVGRDRVFGSKSIKLRFHLPKSLEPIPYKHSFVISGSVSGIGSAGAGVVLQESPFPYLEEFTTVSEPVTTTSTGAFSFRVSSLQTSAAFRIITTSPKPQISSVVKQQVTPVVTLKVHHSSSPGLVRLYGTITPSVTGARVLIQLNKPARPGNTEKTSERTSRFATQFSTTAHKATRTMSHFSTVVKIVHSGHYRAYVALRNKPLQSGASPALSLKAAPSKQKRG